LGVSSGVPMLHLSFEWAQVERQVAAQLALLLAQVLWTVHGSTAVWRADHHGTTSLAEHLWPGPGTTGPAYGGGGL
jgi:hypothetical protein